MKKIKRTALRVVAGIVAVLAIGVGALALLNRPLSRDEVYDAIEAQLRKVVDENEGVSSALLTVAKDGQVHEFAVGTTHPGSSTPATVDSPYHSASVGKTMLAAVFGQLVDEGAMSFDDTVATWLDAETLAGLFVVGGSDHSNEVTVRQLLGHTSGVADYFEGPVTSGATMLETIAADADHRFTPEELLDFTRTKQVAIGSPGQRFHYSDTGYILLGLALEAIEGKPYGEVLEDRIFTPLGMTSSHLMTEFGKPTGILAIDANGVDLSDRNALSVDWAGGGVVTTTADLLTFMRALEGGELISEAVHAQLTDFDHRMQNGIHYGLGIMQFRFSKLSPLLFSMSDAYGAVGATGTFALYDPTGDTYYIANFGSLDYTEKAIEQLVEIRLIFDRLTT